jgi:hypothetical protein
MPQIAANVASLNPGDLIAVAAVVIGFGLTAIMFRVQRENDMRENGERVWIAWSDYLILASVLLAVFLVVIPILVFSSQKLATAASAAAIILQAGYIPAILAHYRIGIGKARDEKKLPRAKGEPAEKWLVIISGGLALVFFLLPWWHSR